MTYSNYNIGQDSLQDVKNGKNREWRKYKKRSLLLADSYFRLDYRSRDITVRKCGSVLDFELVKDGSMRLKRAFFCKDPLCPLCAWRRSLKIFGQVSKVMDVIEKKHNYRYVFATFTVKNVTGVELSETIDKLFKAFNLMTKRKEFKRLSHGFFRALEITHNWERGDDYHPHFHVIVAVNKNYATDIDIYLSHKKWIALWRSCLGVDYDPSVDVRMVKPNEDGTYGKAVAEVSKYAVKSKDYLIEVAKGYEHIDEFVKQAQLMTDEAVYYLHSAIHSRRLVAFGGIFRDIKKQLGFDDIEDGDLIDTDNDDVRGDLMNIVLRYRWHIGFYDYILKEVIENEKYYGDSEK